MHTALERLGVVGPPKTLRFHTERSAMRETEREGYKFERDYRYEVLEDGKPALEVKWIEFLG